ncbi:TPA: DUF624 domain-containing protein [Streptococcus equi subsp. zooepidemicus]|uniref:YesL family protein n=1 Tax=Streptococcus equi TaxID=1336 RepID=UPI0013DCF023|nr:DUF624 domain-containing protein [Streptococcus equi]MDI5988512.1 DUF624 domain-containing protein [Streptococcus equi subsp. zooepidemicus]HEL0020428.1 DUF624 domain-containing protein [Streptococcus equi subsp. zooepidemicus]HEL0558929.1 DUF624 domain-containing protein [Streptococcus equi subsp. zooepidemicus]HEL0585503.1 DUF624 domain-containing protein [Streptococcus equi subsp. zooepidemicus]HEL0608253.1 DUF624 domain-containing protein [Streptococcus equi subsp. zooepidemicus]
MTGIEKACFLIWKMMQLTLIFHLLSLCGAVIFGVGPAWQTIVTLFLETSQQEKHYSLKRAFQIWRRVFKEANLSFFFFGLLLLLLNTSLYLAIQFQSLLWFSLSFIIMFVMVWLVMIVIYMTFYAVTYEIAFWENLKLSFISIFLNAKQFLLTFMVLAGVAWFTWQYKGLYLFLSFGALVVLLDIATKPNRYMIDGVIDDQ